MRDEDISSAILFLSYAGIMASAIFIPNYAKTLGVRESEIGIIIAAYGFASFISSYISGRASDMGGRKKFLLAGLFLTSVSFFLQIFATTKLQLLAIRALSGFSVGIFLSPLIAYSSELGSKTGVFVSFGSLGWAAGSLTAGIISGVAYRISGNENLQFVSAFLSSSLLLLLSTYFAYRLHEHEVKVERIPLFPKQLVKKNFHVYFSSLLRNVGAHAVWAIFPIFLHSLGATSFWIGIIYFLNSISQSIIMRRLDIYDETKLITYGLGFTSLTFFFYTLAPSFYYVMPLQILLALSYSCLYVGSIAYLLKNNQEKAASVGVLNSVIGVSSFIGPMLGGVISERFGYHAALYFASALALVEFLIMKRH